MLPLLCVITVFVSRGGAETRRFGVEAFLFIPHPSSLILHPFPSPFSLCGSAALVSEANGRAASWSVLRAVLCSWFLVLGFWFFCGLCVLLRQEDWWEFEVLLGLRPATSTLRSVGLEYCASSIAISIAIAIGRMPVAPVMGAGCCRCFASSPKIVSRRGAETRRFGVEAFLFIPHRSSFILSLHLFPSAAQRLK